MCTLINNYIIRLHITSLLLSSVTLENRYDIAPNFCLASHMSISFASAFPEFPQKIWWPKISEGCQNVSVQSTKSWHHLSSKEALPRVPGVPTVTPPPARPIELAHRLCTILPRSLCVIILVRLLKWGIKRSYWDQAFIPGIVHILMR